MGYDFSNCNLLLQPLIAFTMVIVCQISILVRNSNFRRDGENWRNCCLHIRLVLFTPFSLIFYLQSCSFPSFYLSLVNLIMKSSYRASSIIMGRIYFPSFYPSLPIQSIFTRLYWVQGFKTVDSNMSLMQWMKMTGQERERYNF